MAKESTRAAIERSWFGDAALLLFLCAQACDGVLTYVGVTVYGSHMEGNPLLSWLMALMGDGPALTAAKLTAGAFGITLHLFSVHKTVAALTLFYLLVAVIPWAAILFLAA
jgi:uncharacterized membrane protein